MTVESGTQAQVAAWEELIGRLRHDDIEAMAETFGSRGYVVVHDLAGQDMAAAVAAELDRLVREHGVRRDFTMAQNGDSPRRMTNVRQDHISANSRLLPGLYQSVALRQLLAAIAREPVHLCPYEPERFVITHLESDGDTHGRHWDDYAFALVWVAHTPPIDDGGFVQCVPNTHWDKENPRLYRQMASSVIHTLELQPGDVYFMRTDTTLHRSRRSSRGTARSSTWASPRPRTWVRPSITHDGHAVGPGGRMSRGALVLAFSGGLDTQVALHWLRADQGWDVVAYIADVGQPGVESAAAVAEGLGVPAHIVDCKDEFARDYVFVATRANAVYHGQYLMGPSLGRPLIAARQVELACRLGAHAVGHGATGRGNDQVRFELTYAALAPELEVVAPWRFWSFTGRSDLLRYAREHDLPVGAQGNRRPFSIDESLVHTSYEGEALEDPAQPPPAGLMQRVADSTVAARMDPQGVTIDFERGNPVAVDGRPAGPAEMIEALNEIGARHGIGRLDLVEDRVFGLKTRNLYEQPAATLLWHAHRAVESMTMDGEVIQLREELVPKYARLEIGRAHV